MMAGVDWITPWLPKGVTLCDGRGIHDISTSEWVLAAIMASVKRLPLYRDAQLRQEWIGQASVLDGFLNESGPQMGQYRVLGEDLADKTVLIVGYGSIGAAIEARLAPFGVKILRVARSAKTEPAVSSIDDLHDLLPQADIVTLTVPLTDQTQGLIGAKELALMKHGALLVNASRGPVVSTDALVEALTQHKIRAALDVTDPEPLPKGHPLWSAPNCLITPHVGGSTPDFIYRAFRFGVAQVKRLPRRPTPRKHRLRRRLLASKLAASEIVEKIEHRLSFEGDIKCVVLIGCGFSRAACPDYNVALAH